MGWFTEPTHRTESSAKGNAKGTEKARKALAKPGDALTGQFQRGVDAAREKRHQALVTLIESLPDVLAQGLIPTINGVRVTAARPFTILPGNTPQRIATANGRLVGWSLLNTGGGAVTVRFRAGRDLLGDVVAAVVVPATSSSTMRVGSAGGLFFGGDGLTIEVTGGTVEGAVHIGEVD